MSSLIFWIEFSPGSIQPHAAVAILLSTVQCSVDVPIHSLCDHDDVMMFSGRNGISYIAIIVRKKRGSRNIRILKTQLHLVSGGWTAQIRFPCFHGFFAPPLCSVGNQMLSRGLPSNSFQLPNFKVSPCNPGQSLIFSSSSSWFRLDKVNIQKLWAIVCYQGFQNLWTDAVLQI